MSGARNGTLRLKKNSAAYYGTTLSNGQANSSAEACLGQRLDSKLRERCTVEVSVHKPVQGR